MPAVPRRLLLVVNPYARNGEAGLQPALDRWAERGIAVEVARFGADRSIDEVIAARPPCDAIVIGGGDGTLNAAAGALVAAGLPVGVLPLGTANDLARTLGLPTDLAAAAAVIAEGHERVIDLGRVNGRFYFNVASIGFSATLAKVMTRDDKRRWGSLAYIFSALRLVSRTRAFTAWLDHGEGAHKVKTMQIAVGNGRYYGGGMTVDPSAEPDDGRLYLYSLEVGHWWRLLVLAPFLRFGRHGAFRDVRILQTTNCHIRTRRPRPINADGELIGQTPAHFTIARRALRVFVPAPAG